MIDPRSIRESYLRELRICPDSIPGRACLRGDWDERAPGLRSMLEAAELERLRNLPEARDD